jgi:hypothetical protein
MWLDDRWETGFWRGDDASAAPQGLCEACRRRAAWLVVGGNDDGFPMAEGSFIERRPVHTCARWSLEGAGAIEDEESLERALTAAGARSIAWRLR